MRAMPQPSIADERALALRTNARSWLRDDLITEEQRRAIEDRTPPAWKRVGLILSVVLFVLALNVLGAMFGFVALFGSGVRASNLLPSGIITFVAALIAAELLIRNARFFGTGIESALWLGGLCAFLFGLPSQGRVEALLAFAAAAAIAGWRVLNPLFGAIALILVAIYVAVKLDQSPWPVFFFCMAVACAALVALGRRVERLSSENLFRVLLLVMPVCGYIGARIDDHATSRTDPLLAAAMLAIAIVFLSAGVVRRGRFELLAGALAIVMATIELQLALDWSVQTKLIAAGVAFVALGGLLSRLLRAKTTGFVVTPTSLTRYDEAMQIAGTIAATPSHAQAPAAPQRESGGGSFGGAGASGDF